jgi:branched-chain amino acid transport system substrate-binding protein
MFSGCLEDAVGTGGLKIGIAQPYTGVASRWGKVSTRSFLSGLASAYEEEPVLLNPDGFWAGERAVFEPGDRKYEVVLRDTTFNPSTAEQATTDLLTEENVDILYGIIDSSSAIRVIEQVVSQTDTLYMAGGTASMRVTSEPNLCGRKIFRTSEHIGMEARAIGTYIGQETDTETAYLLGVDSAFGRSFARMYRSALEENGVEVVGERFVPSGFSEFRGILGDIDNQAEALGVGFTARTLQPFLDTFVKGTVAGAFDLEVYAPLPGQLGMGLVGDILDTTLDEVTRENIDELNIGGLASRYHWNQYENPINDEFVSGFEQEYGTLPALFAGGAFTAGSAVAQAVEETGSQDPDDIADAMYGMTVEKTPKGEGGYVFQEHNNQAKSPMTVANLVPNEEENWGASVMPSEPVARVSADEAAVPVDDPDMNCDLTSE